MDNKLRQLEKENEKENTFESWSRLVSEQYRAGYEVKDTTKQVFENSEGWVVRSLFPSGEILSSATESHDGWWGIGHMLFTFEKTKQEPYVGINKIVYSEEPGSLFLGNHYCGSYYSLYTQDILPPPEKRKVLKAHLQVIKGLNDDDIGRVLKRRPRDWYWLEELNSDLDEVTD